MLPIFIPELINTVGSLSFFDGYMEVSSAFIPKLEPSDSRFLVESNPINLSPMSRRLEGAFFSSNQAAILWV